MEATRARLPLEKKKASNVVSFAGTVLQWRMLGNRAIWSSAEALLLVLYSVSVHSTHSLNKVALKHSLLLGCGQPPPPWCTFSPQSGSQARTHCLTTLQWRGSQRIGGTDCC